MKKNFTRLNVILLAVSLIMCWLFTAFAMQPAGGSDKKTIKSYLDRNNASLDIGDNNNFSSFELIKDDLEENEIFLTGEVHAVGYNKDIEFKMLKYLNQRAGVRYYLTEMGYASGQIINEYLRTGDEDKLKLVYSELEGTAAFNNEDYGIWKKVYEYNKTLPEDKKIIVVGADIEHQVNTAMRYLKELAADVNPPKEIQYYIDKIGHPTFKNNNEFYNFIRKLNINIRVNEEIYKKSFGANYFDFLFVSNNILNRNEAYGSNAKYELREKSICDNFKKLYEHLPKGKYYGEWGMEHVYQRLHINSVFVEMNFANWLSNTYTQTRGKVISIAYFYSNCKYMIWGREYGVGYADANGSNLSLLEPYAKSNITLYKLNGDNSPFKNEIITVPDPDGGVETDYYQYIVLIKDSPPTTPYGN